MPQCPVCETKYQEKAEYCSTCGWDLGDNQRAKLTWARQQWQKSKLQLMQLNHDRAQFKRHWREVLAKLDKINQPTQPEIGKTLMKNMGKQLANIQMQLRKVQEQHSLFEVRLAQIEEQLDPMNEDFELEEGQYLEPQTREDLDLETKIMAYREDLISPQEEKGKKKKQIMFVKQEQDKKQQNRNIDTDKATQVIDYKEALAFLEEDEKDNKKNVSTSQKSKQDRDETMSSHTSEKVVDIVEPLDDGMSNIDLEPEVIFFKED